MHQTWVISSHYLSEMIVMIPYNDIMKCYKTYSYNAFYTHFIRHICCASLSNVKCRFISEMTHKFENNFTLTFYTLKHVTHSDKSIESPRRARIHKVAQVKIKVLVLRLDLSFSIHNTWIWGKEKSSWNKLSPVCFKNIFPDCTQTSDKSQSIAYKTLSKWQSLQTVKESICKQLPGIGGKV